jgi:hypothetical protein
MWHEKWLRDSRLSLFEYIASWNGILFLIYQWHYAILKAQVNLVTHLAHRLTGIGRKTSQGLRTNTERQQQKSDILNIQLSGHSVVLINKSIFLVMKTISTGRNLQYFVGRVPDFVIISYNAIQRRQNSFNQAMFGA